MYNSLLFLCSFVLTYGGILTLHRLAGCEDCESAGPRSYRCMMQVTGPVALVVECQVDTPFTGPSVMVLEVVGDVGEAFFMSTILTCRDRVSIRDLNGQTCLATSTATTTTKGGWPFPIPVPGPQDNGEDEEELAPTSTASTTTDATTTTTESTTTTTTARTIVVTTAWSINGTTVFICIGLLLTATRVFVTVRCLVRRRRRRSATINPLQVNEVPSTSEDMLPAEAMPLSPRRRRALRPESLESVELFAVTELD